MSARHREERAYHAPKELRQQENRRTRRQAHQELHDLIDPEDAIISRPVHNMKSEHPGPPKHKDTMKHWRRPFWKRRNQLKVEPTFTD